LIQEFYTPANNYRGNRTRHSIIKNQDPCRCTIVRAVVIGFPSMLALPPSDSVK